MKIAGEWKRNGLRIEWTFDWKVFSHGSLPASLKSEWKHRLVNKLDFYLDFYLKQISNADTIQFAHRRCFLGRRQKFVIRRGRSGGVVEAIEETLTRRRCWRDANEKTQSRRHRWVEAIEGTPLRRRFLKCTVRDVCPPLNEFSISLKLPLPSPLIP